LTSIDGSRTLEATRVAGNGSSYRGEIEYRFKPVERCSFTAGGASPHRSAEDEAIDLRGQALLRLSSRRASVVVNRSTGTRSCSACTRATRFLDAGFPLT
jgi:hypothetical protein